jgi:protein Xni
MSVHLVLIDALNLIRRIYAVQERPFLLNNELAENTKQQVLFNTEKACEQALRNIVEQLQPTHALAVLTHKLHVGGMIFTRTIKKAEKKCPSIWLIS